MVGMQLTFDFGTMDNVIPLYSYVKFNFLKMDLMYLVVYFGNN
jgi:hypothetical protein